MPPYHIHSSIYEKLTEDGWGDDVVWLTENLHVEKGFKALPEVRKSQALTQKSKYIAYNQA
jgi:hypothetical protein